MTTRHFLVALCLLVAAAVEAKHLVKRQVFPPVTGQVDCSRGGLVADPSDCSRYYDCNYGGVGVLMSCLKGLDFNPTGNNGQGSCDYPGTFTRSSNCVETNARKLKAELTALCKPDPNANISQAFTKPHPNMCNAFYMCSANYIHGPCMICAPGTYFVQGGNTCVPFPNYVPEDPKNPNPQPVACPDNTQRRYVNMREVTLTRVSGECSIFQQ